MRVVSCCSPIFLLNSTTRPRRQLERLELEGLGARAARLHEMHHQVGHDALRACGCLLTSVNDDGDAAADLRSLRRDARIAQRHLRLAAITQRAAARQRRRV